MGLLKNPFKLEKLNITAYKGRGGGFFDYQGSFEAMFNPESYSEAFQIQYNKCQGLNSTGKELKYARSRPRELKLKLIIDGTGVSNIGLAALFVDNDVTKKIDKFLDLTFRMNGDIHEPNFLIVQWGDNLEFSGRLSSADIKYTLFKRDGSPLRAELDVVFLADEKDDKRLIKENKKSPDLTHTRIVKSADTLPLLAVDIYQDPLYYMQIAAANKLNNFRKTRAGSEIKFPPIRNQ